MSTKTPSPLVDVAASVTFRQGVDDNFTKLVDRSWKVVANEVSGTPTTALGAPTTGAHVIDELWRDPNGAEFRCTVPGTPGTWIQIHPGVVSSEPVGAPSGYWIVRADQNFTPYYESGGSYLPVGGGSTATITPTTLSADTDDWAPTGFATALIVRAAASGAVSLFGLAGGAAGRTVYLHNIGAEVITLSDEAGTSTAANRFDLPADHPIEPADVVVLQYDGTSSRWRIVGGGIRSDFAGREIYNFVARERTITGNATAAASDCALWVNVNSVGDITFTVDSAVTLPPGFTVTFFQMSSGKCIFAEAGAAQIHNWQGADRTAGSYAIAMLKRIGSTNEYVLTGNVI